MSRSERGAVALGVCTLLIATLAAAADYGLGRPATPAEVAAWDIDVRPDGQGLPKGRGSVDEGQAVFDAKCAVCHGTFGESGDYIQLAGGVGSLRGSAPVRTVGSLLANATTLFDYIYRAMPFPDSKSLSWDETYAVTAYVLYLNEILPADAVLDQQSLPKVKMPNAEGYTTQHGFGTIKGRPDVHNTACMKNCATEVKLASELPANFVANVYGDLSNNFRGLATMNHGVPAAEPAAAAAPLPAAKLAEKNACLTCHATDRRMIGPGYNEVAVKYRGDASAPARLAGKIRSGGSGVWGTIPMPPQGQLSDDELKSLVDWILAMAPAK